MKCVVNFEIIDVYFVNSIKKKKKLYGKLKFKTFFKI